MLQHTPSSSIADFRSHFALARSPSSDTRTALSVWWCRTTSRPAIPALNAGPKSSTAQRAVARGSSLPCQTLDFSNAPICRSGEQQPSRTLTMTIEHTVNRPDRYPVSFRLEFENARRTKALPTRFQRVPRRPLMLQAKSAVFLLPVALAT